MNYIEVAKDVLANEAKGIEFVSSNLTEDFNKAVGQILNMQGRLVITGMGKSGHVGKKIAATLASTGTSSFFIHPGEAYHGDLGMIKKSDIVMAISNSGETEEVIKLLSFFKDNGNEVIGLTGKATSTLAKHSDYFINISVPMEACPLALAPTTSTTVTMAMGDAFAVALMKARDFRPENFARFHPGGSLGRKLLTRARDLMKVESLPIVSPGTMFEQVVNEMTEGRIGAVLVSRDGKKLDEIITNGDISRAFEKFKDKVFDLKATDISTKNPKTVAPNDKIVEVEELMQDKKISVLVVADEIGDIQGIISRYDI